MLKRFRVSNFKSLLNVEFKPVGLNLLVGPNNAGKTNLCHALRFLKLTSQMPLYEAARQCTAEPWNLLNVYTKDDILEIEAHATLNFQGKAGPEPLEFTYLLRLKVRRNGRQPSDAKPLAVDHENLRVSGGGFENTTLLDMDGEARVTLLHEEHYLERKGAGDQPIVTTGRCDTSMLFRLYDLDTNRRANLFRRYLNAWGYYCVDPNQMRSSSATPMERALSSDGSNVSSVLFTLNSEQPRKVRKLIDSVKLLEPHLDAFSFQSPDPEHVYMFLEDKEGHRFGVQNVSDGTLRYVALSLLVIAHRMEDEAAEFSPLLMIEEPENGVYVGYLKPLFEKVDPTGNQGQFIFTSHNPYFIDLFDGDLDGVHLVKNLGNHSLVTKPDAAKLAQRLGQFSLGEMHFRELWE